MVMQENSVEMIIALLEKQSEFQNNSIKRKKN